MKKIAFVVVRYGKEINGGAELHCRMLAERLVPYYQVEVLTTCAYNAQKDYAEGKEMINGVTVRRFKTISNANLHLVMQGLSETFEWDYTRFHY